MAEAHDGPMVGRDAELARVTAAFERAAAGDPRVVLVSGEAGIGKSRLVEALADRVAAAGGRALIGACLDLADGGLPLAPLAEALRGVPATDGAALPGVASVRAEGGDEPLDAARLYEGTLGLLGALAADRPTLLAVEDSHWIDRATRDLVSFLVRNLVAERLLVVLTARSEDLAPELAGWLAELGRHRRVERLALDRLDRAGVRAQLAALSGAAPTRADVDRIYARSEGNPLFVEELAALGTGDVPATIGELVTARLSRLGAAAREVVRVVAIGGRSIEESLVAEVTDRPIETVRAALREAVEHRILVAAPEDTRIGFRHALVREVAASELLRGEQASLHARLAEILAARPELAEPSPAGAAAELAFHWEAAGDAPRALAAAIEAAGAAARVAAWADADRQYARALRLVDRGAPLPEDTDRPELQRRASEAAELDGDLERALRLADDGLAAIDARTQPERAALLGTRIGYLRWALGDTDAALAAYEAARAMLPLGLATAVRGRVLASLANALFGKGRYPDALAAASEAVEVSLAAGARPEEARARNVLGSIRVALGDVNEGLAELQRSRDIAASVGPADMRVVSAYNLAVNLAMAGRLAEAEGAARDGREAARAEGLERRYGPDIAALEGDVLTRLGRWDEAARVIDAAIALDPDGTGSVYLAIARARLHALRGATTEAHDWFARVASMAGEHLDADLAGYLARARAELALVEGRLADAAAICRDGLAPLEGTEDHFVRSPLLALAVSVAAELADEARARRDADAGSAARTDAEPYLAELRGMASTAAPIARALAAQAAAEWTRLEGAADPEPWRMAIPLLAAIPDPYAVAQAELRVAEAALRRDGVRADVTEPLRVAASTADALGARPLRRAVDELARRARVDLEDRAGSATPEAVEGPSPTRLSAREIEVLRLVADGRTNGEIAEALFITRKTAGVHVTHILDKLGVANRVEAAMAASRLGLLAEPDPEVASGEAG